MSEPMKSEKLPMEPPSAAVWFSLLAAPTAWAGQGLAGWLITETACADGPAVSGYLSGGAVYWIVLGVSVLALILAGSALGIAIRLYHQNGGSLTDISGQTRTGFMAVVGVLVSSVFLVAIFWATLPLLSLPLCESIR